MTFDILSWTDPMRETLIKNFQKNECLWNIIDVDYRNIAKKRQILCDMAKEMSETFGVCIGSEQFKFAIFRIGSFFPKKASNIFLFRTFLLLLFCIFFKK